MANKNRFTINDAVWEIVADGTAISPVGEVSWAGDTGFTKTSPTLGEDEAATIVHLFLPETYYLAEDDSIFACVSADTYDNTGIEKVNFYYGSGTPTAVSTVTQRIMPDGTKVQGYWFRLDNTSAVPTGHEDRTLYAEAVPRSPSTMPARVVSRTVRIMEDASHVHTVTLNAGDLDLTNDTINDENLHANIVRYNRDNGTQHKAIEFVLTPGMYFLQPVGVFPFPDNYDTGGVAHPSTEAYRRIRSSTGDPHDVTIALTQAAPGTTANDEDSFYPGYGYCNLRNFCPIEFRDVSIDMFNVTAFSLSGTLVGKNPALVFDGCIIKDTNMSYGKTPTGRQAPALTVAQKDTGADAVLPYSQYLFRAGNTALPVNASMYNSFISTIVAGGLTAIFNCEGAVWFDTLYCEATNLSFGVNNFRHITTYGENLPGTDLDTERYVDNQFGLTTGGTDINGKYYYDYADSVGDASIAKGTREINRITWVAQDGTLYDTLADLQTAGKNPYEYRVYFEEDFSKVPARASSLTEGGATHGYYTGGTRFYDFDFFVWKENGGAPLSFTDRQFAAKGYSSSAFCISWIDDSDWGKDPYPPSVAQRVRSGGNIYMSWADSPPTFLVGGGVDPKDPAKPYMRAINTNRYTNPDAVPLFAAEGLDAETDTLKAYYDAGGLNPIVDNLTPLDSSMLSAIDSWGFAAGDRIVPLFWYHQDVMQTLGNRSIHNCLLHDYTSVLEQQVLYQGSGEVGDMVWSNVLLLDPKDEAAKFYFRIENPVPARIGIKGTTLDNYLYLVTKDKQANGDKIHIWVEGSNPSEFNGNSDNTMPAGDFDVTLKDSAYGKVAAYATALLGRDNNWTDIDNEPIPGYTAGDGNKAWGITKYGAVETGSLLETHLTSNPVSLDLGSVLPYDIKGIERNANSMPTAISSIDTGGEGSETIVTELTNNRFNVIPAGNNAQHKTPSDVAEIYYTGRLIKNNGATRTYKWMRGSDVIVGASAATYTVQAADVGKMLTCFISADGVTEAIPFGIIKP